MTLNKIHPRDPLRGAIALLSMLLISATAWSTESGDRVIATANAVLRLDRNSGDLVGIAWKHPGLEIIGEPRLGENFRILLPQADSEACYFLSREQKLAKIEEISDGVVCEYASLRNAREEVPLRVRYWIRSIGSQIQFSIEVDNPTDRKLAEVEYGMIGGQQGIGNRLDTESLIPANNASFLPHAFTSFQGGSYGGGNLGIRYDATGLTYPGKMPMGWMDVFNRKTDTAYYYANQDAETRTSALYLEMRPFTKSAVVGDNWPGPADVPPGEPIGITMGWVDFPYLAKGTFRAGPVALEGHRGDWHAGGAIYRSWYDRNFPIKRAPSWLRNEMAWQSIMLASPEDVVFHRFAELPELAADAKKYGVTTFEILGWDLRGIDRGYPQYRPNPRLGTPEEFARALAAIRAMGVHPLIFANIQVADTATPVFQNDLRRYAVEGRWAPDWSVFGYGQSTVGARMGLARSNMTFVSPAHPEFREYLMRQFIDLVKDGAEGLQLDKALATGYLDFNPRLPIGPDKSLIVGVLSTYKELLEKARTVNPNFALASEMMGDRALPYVDVSYMRINSIDMDSTAFRYTFPEWTSTIFGESPGDFNPMNNGLRYGLVWDLAPRHYTDSMDEALTRPLSRYVSELIRIRKQYGSLLFHGRFNDTMGATVTGDSDIRFSVFKPMEPGSPGQACVVVNFGNRTENAEVSFPGLEGARVEVSMPFHQDRWETLPFRLALSPTSAAVVVSPDCSAEAIGSRRP